MGNYHPKFYGGKYVRDFEDKLSKYYNMKYAITFNSWTSGLIAAVGALDANPGDEVIVPTWTMTACPTSILWVFKQCLQIYLVMILTLIQNP